MEAPKRATKFAANDEWGKVYRKAFGVEKMNQSLSIITGASAGATEAFVVVPFELVKIRLQGESRSFEVLAQSRGNRRARASEHRTRQAALGEKLRWWWKKNRTTITRHSWKGGECSDAC